MAQQQKEIVLDDSDGEILDDSGNVIPKSKVPAASPPSGILSGVKRGWDAINAPLVTFPDREKMIEGLGGRETWPGWGADLGLGMVEGATSLTGALTGGIGAEVGAGKLGFEVTRKALQRANQAMGGASVVSGLSDLNQGNNLSGAVQIGMGALGLRGPKSRRIESPKVGAKPSVSAKAETFPSIKILPEDLKESQTTSPAASATVNDPVKPKPKVRLNKDGTYTNMDTGEILDKTGKPVPIPNSSVVPTPKLPPNLAGAKPRFNLGDKPYIPNFESDLDKAFFIVAQIKKSPHNDEYLKFIMDHTGLNEQQVMAEASKIKSLIKAAVKGRPAGEVKLGKLWVDPRVQANKVPPSPSSPTAPQIKPVPLENETTQLLDAMEKGKPTPTFTSLDDVIENIKQRTDWTPEKKANVIKGLQEREINPVTGELPRNPGLVGTMNSYAKTLLTWDLPFVSSAVGRQGLPMWHTKAFWTSLDDMVKAYGSSKVFDAQMEGIKTRQLFQQRYDDLGNPVKSAAQIAKLHLPGVFDELKDERFAQNRLSKFFPMKANERAFHGFLNQLRADHFETLYNAAKNSGIDVDDPEFLKTLGNTINIATGHGDLGRYQQHLGELNKWFFAPSFSISRWNMLDPRQYKNLDPINRRARIKNLLALAAGSQAIGGLTYLAGTALGGRGGVSSIENTINQPGTSDMGRTTFGNPIRGKTSFDAGAGIHQPAALVTRMLLDMSKVAMNSSMGTRYEVGGFGKDNAWDQSTNYLANRLNPVQRFMVNWAKNSGFASDSKEGFDFSNELASNIAPIFMQDLHDVAFTNPELLPLVLGASAIGMGATTYTK